MTPAQAIKSGFKKYFVFRGRAGVTEFWWVVSLIWGGILLAGLADVLIFMSEVKAELAEIDQQTEPLRALDAFFGLVDQYRPKAIQYPVVFLTIPAFSVGARRLHDTRKSGWRQVSILLPMFFGIAFTGIGYLMERLGIFEGNAILLPAFLALIGGGAMAFATFDRVGDAGRNVYGPVPER